MLGCGTATAIVPFLTSYSSLGIVAGVFGFAISANYSLTSPILVDLVSLEQFSNAYGLLLLVQGISNLVGPPFAGYLYDVTKKWHYSFALVNHILTFILKQTNRFFFISEWPLHCAVWIAVAGCAIFQLFEKLHHKIQKKRIINNEWRATPVRTFRPK